MEITLHKLDLKVFPVECCGIKYPNPKELMDHLLPAHEAEKK